MSADSFRFGPYVWRGGREWMLARGPRCGAQVLLICPLFEETNFTRTLLGEIGRGLAGRGIGTWLPDLPGTGESALPLASIGWDDWRDAARAAGEAVTAVTGTRPFTCAFRGGALLDDAVAATARWRYAPAGGDALLRQLRRTQLVADHEAGLAAVTEGAIVELAGYRLSTALREGLAASTPAAVADREVPAMPDGTPWRRAEPSGNRILSELLADDICEWIATCAN